LETFILLAAFRPHSRRHPNSKLGRKVKAVGTRAVDDGSANGL